MKRYARVLDGKVSEIIEIVDEVDIADLTPEGYTWIPAGAEVRDGWLYRMGKLVPPAESGPTLDELKALKSAEITAACLIAIDGGFFMGEHPYDSDIASRTNIIGTATGVQAGIPLPEGFTWRTSYNDNVPMDGADVIALGAALLRHVNEQYAISWQLKGQIEAATSPQEVAAISWPSTP